MLMQTFGETTKSIFEKGLLVPTSAALSFTEASLIQFFFFYRSTQRGRFAEERALALPMLAYETQHTHPDASTDNLVFNYKNCIKIHG